MENYLRKKNKQLQVLVAPVEQSLLLEHSQKNANNNTDCYADSIIDNSFHTHLKDADSDERTKKNYVLNLNGLVSNYKSVYDYTTDSSSDDECSQSCVNITEPKSRKLSTVWLETRTAIGSKWRWLDLQLAIIDNEISKVSTKLMEIKPINSQCSLPYPDSCARCIPFTPPHSGKKHLLYRKEPAKRSQSLDSTDTFEFASNSNNNNIKQHINFTNPFSEDIASSSIVYDTILNLSYQHYPIVVKKLEQFLEISLIPSSITSLMDSKHPATMPTKPNTAHSMFRKKTARSYDTTQIIMPDSFVPKLEKPVYREIITPSWRIYNINKNNNNDINNNNNNNNNNAITQEAITDLEFEVRHTKCEILEKQRYTNTTHYTNPTTSSSNSNSKKHRRIFIAETTIPHIAKQYFPVRNFPLSDFELEQIENHICKKRRLRSSMRENETTLGYYNIHSVYI